jgi:late competence protein required for DNA uptake (superfamily II DNA/RNA helicase)
VTKGGDPGRVGPSRGTPERACYRCGAEEDLVADENVEGVWICRACLARVEVQNELIRRGLEDEPDAEL